VEKHLVDLSRPYDVLVIGVGNAALCAAMPRATIVKHPDFGRVWVTTSRPDRGLRGEPAAGQHRRRMRPVS
jgi:hypothetical protein